MRGMIRKVQHLVQVVDEAHRNSCPCEEPKTARLSMGQGNTRLRRLARNDGIGWDWR